MTSPVGNDLATNGFFITGTDTGVGKTLVATALIQLLANRGNKVIGMKPVASGCTQVGDQWQNDDAQALMAVSNVDVPYKLVNPYAFEPAIAPHLAASHVDENISIEVVQENFQTLRSVADKIIVEGAGGWLVPISDKASMADLAAALGLPVILVVGLRLGCLNHALLSVQSIIEKGTNLSGWVANSVDPQFVQELANIETLKSRISAPCLGVIPYSDKVRQVDEISALLTLVSD